MCAQDALRLLGLPAPADPDQLRSAYLSAVKTAHPDRPGGDAERLRRVIEAYEFLRDRRAPEPPAAPRAGPSAPPRPSSRRLEISPMQAVFGGVHAAPMRGAGDATVRLPPGLRSGDLIGVTGVAMTIAIVADERSTFVGDNLCVRIEVERSFLAAGGRLELQTPQGPMSLQVSRQDAARGLVRIDGGMLPDQGRHPPVQMFVKLETAPAAAGSETRTRALLRRFTAAWAA
jgi:curved DNA-binding protein